MGSWAHFIVVNGDEALLDFAETRANQFEALWSRFIDSSDISRLNAAQGTTLTVAPETVTLIGHAIEAWTLTGGRFDPTILDALEAIGYDRTFDEIVGNSDLAPTFVVPGCKGIIFDPAISQVQLPRGVSIDVGGIAKGFAADILAKELITQGAQGALANFGGDMRMIGLSPEAGNWLVELDEPLVEGLPLTQIALKEGAVATSTTKRRTWQSNGEQQHHLIDPTTGAPFRDCNQLVTCIAGEAWWAEAMTKLLIDSRADTEPELDEDATYAALVVTEDGRQRQLGTIAGYLLEAIGETNP